MPTRELEWVIAPPAPPEIMHQYMDMNPILAQILYNRGFADAASAVQFLVTKQMDLNPFVMKGMNQAVTRIRSAIRDREEIAVYGDFDADGVTATTLLVQVLKALGANVRAYIPHRVDEGYGLNSPALIGLAEEGVQLVITVDCGIRSIQEVEDGKAAGLDIIITDHHSIGSQIPDALAVINPQQEDCRGEAKLAGVGVAYMLALGLLRAEQANGGTKLVGNPEKELLDLVAIGTVADIMPLNIVANRCLVRNGLDVINEKERIGLLELLRVAGREDNVINAMDIGFMIGPRINAAGRLESATIAYDLLSTDDTDTAIAYATELQTLNEQRRKMTADAVKQFSEPLEDAEDVPSIIITGDENVMSGIVGLVAGKLVEAYYRPAIVMEYGDTESRASCRSIPEFHITHALDECADLLVRHGGHAMAAGFTIRNENLPAFTQRITQLANDELADQNLIPKLEIDMQLEMRDLSLELVDELAQLEPTGNSNPAPIFVTRDMQIRSKRTVGSDDAHLKLQLAKSGRMIDGIGFGLGDQCDSLLDFVDVAYRLEINEWNGRTKLQMNIVDIKPSQKIRRLF